MAQYDGSIIIDTEINSDGMEFGSKEIEQSVTRMTSKIKDLGASAKKSLASQVDSFMRMNQQYSAQAQKVEELSQEVASLGSERIETEEYKKLGEEFEGLRKEAIETARAIDEMAEQKEKLATTPVENKSIDRLKNKLEETRRKSRELEEAMDATFKDKYGDILIGRSDKYVNEMKAMDAEYARSVPELEKLGQLAEDVEDRMHKAAAAQEKLNIAAQEELDNKIEEATYALDAYNKKMGEVHESQMKMKISGSNLIDPTTTKEFENAYSKLEAGETKLSNMGDRLANRFQSIKESISSYNKEVIKTATSSDKATRATKKQDKATKDLGRSAGGARRSLGKLFMMALGFGTLLRIFNALRQFMVEGFKNLSKESSSTNNSISSIMSALATLKNALATAFAPILNVIAPILTKFINMLSTAATYVSMFFSVLAGKSTYTKAIAQNIDYAKSQEGAADATKANADALRDAEKAAKGYLSPIDEINKLEVPDLTSSNSSSGSSGANAPDAKKMFEEVGLDGQFSNLADKVKDIFGKIFQPFKNAWDKEGQATIDAAKYALSSIVGLAGSIGKAFLEAWADTGLGEAICVNILQIIRGMFEIVGHLANRLREAWEANGNGKAIFEAILKIVNNLLSAINRCVQATVEWAEKIDYTPILDSIRNLLEKIEPLSKTVFDGLAWFYENVLLPISTWVIQDAIPAFLDLLASAIGAVNEVLIALQPLGEWLFYEFLAPLGKWTGGVIVDVLRTLTDLLDRFATWCSENPEKVQMMAIIIGAFFAAFKIVSLVTKLGTLIGSLGGVIGIVDKLGGLIGSVLNPWVLAVAAVIAIGILLYKNWDTVKEWAIKTWTKVQEIFQKFGNFIKGIFQKDWTETFGIMGHGLNAFLASVGNIFGGIKQIFNGIITFVKGVFTGNWRMAWQGIKDIFGGIFDSLIGIVKTPINSIIGIINSLIDGIAWGVNGIANMINSMRISIPDWVPFIGGASWSPNLPTWTPGRIPYLAKGAVIPPNAPFMAMLGDQKSGNNIEAPEGLIRKIVREESGNGGQGGSYRFTAQLNGRTLFEEFMNEAKLRQMSTGRNPFETV